MDELQIHNALKRVSTFRGTFPKDLIPENLAINESMIVNMDKSFQTGSHWIVFVHSPEGLILCDSLGIVWTMDEAINKAVKRLKNRTLTRRMLYNKHRLQGLFANTCGLYCVFLIRLLSETPLAFCDFLYLFNLRDYQYNDSFVCNAMNIRNFRCMLTNNNK